MAAAVTAPRGKALTVVNRHVVLEDLLAADVFEATSEVHSKRNKQTMQAINIKHTHTHINRSAQRVPVCARSGFDGGESRNKASFSHLKASWAYRCQGTICQDVFEVPCLGPTLARWFKNPLIA